MRTRASEVNGGSPPQGESCFLLTGSKGLHKWDAAMGKADQGCLEHPISGAGRNAGESPEWQALTVLTGF